MSEHFEILKKYAVRAKKSFGQNFLVNDGILKKITTAIPVHDRNILEV
jgi:16S rRNA A1518/A1519 N6-dimethyltransferase RsmA/KsgA/DIM1 with predicted DNA glycosylase/AP lyase activity